MTYPFVPGMLSASALNAAIAWGRPLYVEKSTDGIPVNNSTTFRDDDTLTLTLPATAEYEFLLLGKYLSAAAADFKIQFTIPTGAAMTNPVYDCIVGGVHGWGLCGANGSVTGIDGTGASVPITIQGKIITGITGGDLTVQWAQNTANVSDTYMQAGSSLRLLRIG